MAEAVADFGEDVEGGEVLLILVLVGVGLYYLSKAGFNLGSWFSNVLNQSGLGEATVTNNQTPSFVGGSSGNPSATMTPAQARSIAVVLGQDGKYTVSPDRTQVWFYDGSYYDNATGHLYAADGTDQGTIG